MMKLAMLVEALRQAGALVSAPDHLPEVSDIEDDSRRVRSGMLFCAVEGTVHDGHDHVAEAVRRGACAVVVTRDVRAGVPQVIVRDSRTALAILAHSWYGTAADDLMLIGVTGTNGKTTTVALIRHVLNADGRSGSLGTLGALDGAGRPVAVRDDLTTQGVLGLQAALSDLRERGVVRVALEASSHALDQQRLANLTLEAAVYTNLTHEHLDYHASIHAYRDAKAALSTMVRSGGVEVINVDDPAWAGLPRRRDLRRVTYGTTPAADVHIVDPTLAPDGARGRFVFGDTEVPVHVPLLGGFNVANALAAAAATWSVGIAPTVIAERLASAPQVPGRLEPLACGEWLVLRDYAHTPDALVRVIAALRPITEGRLIVLFGAGGDRDRAKRPIMGRAVAAGADLPIVTSDNPRTEDPDRIIDEIETGMGLTPHVRITDRREAILHALTLLQPGDCLLLAGKGHETYQVIGTEYLPFDERDIVRSAVAGGVPE